jgi:hypothetical protein
MNLQVAEPSTERDVTSTVESVLVAEEDHLPLQQCRPNGGDHVVGQGGREVNPADLGANRRREWFNLRAPKA